jgi:hypothetical protein
MVEYLGNNALTGAVAGGAAGLFIGGAVGYAAGKRSNKKAKRKRNKSTSGKKRNSTSKHKGRKLKFGSPAYRKKYLGKRRKKQKQPRTAGKRKDTSHRRIRYTKNNQPYIILSNGRARFISKKSAKSSRTRKGGKY